MVQNTLLNDVELANNLRFNAHSSMRSVILLQILTLLLFFLPQHEFLELKGLTLTWESSEICDNNVFASSLHLLNFCHILYVNNLV